MTLKPILIFFLFFCLITTGSYAQESFPDSSNMVTLRIDPANARGGKVSDVFSEIEFIPLETTKESLFGSIENLHVVDGNFVFTDIDTHSLYIFSNDGKFRRKINGDSFKSAGINVGDSPSFEFTPIKFDGQIALHIYVRGKEVIFSLDAKLLKIIKTDKNVEQSFRRMFFKWPNDFVGFNVPYFSKTDTAVYEVSTFKNNKVTGNYLPWDFKSYGSSTFIVTRNGLFNSGNADEYLYTRQFDYNVYSITPTKISLAYRFVFTKDKTLPKTFTTTDNGSEGSDWVYKHDRVVYGIGNTFIIGKKLFFKAESIGGKNSLIHNLETSALSSIEDLAADSLSRFLPISDLGISNDFRSKGLQTFENGSFFTSISSLAMFALKDQIKDKNFKFDDRLTSYFAKENRKSNPVIIRLKPKTD